MVGAAGWSEAATVQLAFKRDKHTAGTLKFSARAGKDKIASG
jgi:hypothetical protein